MSAATQIAAPTAAAYEAAFEDEAAQVYPAVDAFEARMGFALAPERLLAAARVLACPVKAHPPNWQHGRVLYAVAREYLARMWEPVVILDIGTAKGFSALCLHWALVDAQGLGAVVSVDVLDPAGRVRRNTVAEVDGFKTLAEIQEPWPEAGDILFLKSTGVAWLETHPARVHVAFVDGKHSGGVVHVEGMLLAMRQSPGDLVIFDDLQIDGVCMAVSQLSKVYDIEILQVREGRQYGIGVRRG